MRKLLLMLGMVSGFAFTTNTPYNWIVEYVNSGVITNNELTQQSNFIYNTNFKGKVFSQEEESILRSKILDQMIMDNIEAGLAERQGISVTKSEVESTIANIATSKKLSVKQLTMQLATDGIASDYFHQVIATQLLNQKLKQVNVDYKIMVTEQDIQKIMNSDVYKNQINYDLSSIVVSLPQGATSEQVAQKQKIAEDVYKKLQSGADFAKLAVEYSDAPNSSTGGELGVKSSLSLPPEIVSALSSTNVGGFTDIIKLPIGFFIFKINNRISADKPVSSKLDEYHVRHILIKVNELNSEQDGLIKITQLYKNIIESSNPQQEFAVVAKQYSQDTSAINGGDLSWIKKGDTVSEFESTVLNAKVGVISKPVRTQFGWHLIEVIDKKTVDNAKSVTEAQVRINIMQSKEAILYNEWLQSLRQGASVEISLGHPQYESN